jgi:tyrosinase
MKLLVALCATAATAASLPVADSQEGFPLSDFDGDEFPALTPEQIAAGEDKLNLDYILSQRSEEQGWPLSAFPDVLHLNLDQIRRHEDLGHNDFGRLPIFGPGHHRDLQSFLDETRHRIGHEVHFLVDEIRGQTKDGIEDFVVDLHNFLEPRDAGDCSNPNVRYEWDDYSATDKKAFISAIQCLIKAKPSGKFGPSRNRYEDFVRLHQTYAPNIHSESFSVQTHKFLLWHRYYLWAFEQVLRDECGFNKAMPVSYLRGCDWRLPSHALFS